MTYLRTWATNGRYGSLIQSLMPCLVAIFVAIGNEHFSFVLSVFAFLGVASAHLCFNLLDDYFDYKSHETGYRNTLDRAGFRAYTAKCPYITDGSATLKDLKKAVYVFGIFACLCGLIVLLFRGWSVLLVTGITFVLAYFYSGAPLRLSYHGLGELVIGVIFGPLNIIGTSIAAKGSFGKDSVLLGVIFGLLVINILYTHSVLDFAADQSVKKNTMASLFRNQSGRLLFSYLVNLFPYGMIAVCIAMKVISPWYGLAFFAFPVSAALCLSMHAFGKGNNDVVWKPWYGKFPGNFEEAKKMNLAWFLMRWVLARNIVAYIAVLWIIADIIVKVAS